MAQVNFGNTSVNTGFITTYMAQQPLSVKWIADPNLLYTVIMYDIDAPYPAPNNYISPYLHLLITNIKGMDIGNGDQLIQYQSPHPPSDSLPHTYNVDIYLQKGNIVPVEHRVRVNFNLMGFVNDHELQLVDRTSFKVGSVVATAGSLLPIPSSIAVPPTPIQSSVSISHTPSLVPSPRKAETTNYFKPDTNLTEKQQKWCRCVLKVADKQRGGCNIERAWFETRDGKTCYNPYAVCSASVGTSTRECGKNYDFDSFSDNHLLAYAELHQKDKDGIIIEIPDPYNREVMLRNIKRWKEIKENNRNREFMV